MICYGYECKNDKYNKGDICCNDCLVDECAYRCPQIWEMCNADYMCEEE